MKTAFKKIAEMMHHSCPDESFAFEFWDGDRISFGKAPCVTLRFKNKECVKKIIENGYMGFGESYMERALEIVGDVQRLFRMGFSINFDEIRLSFLEKLRFFIISLLNRDTLRRAPKNISHHYDLGNEFYSLFLDNTMTYSCAYFNKENDSLEQAQLNKYEHISRKLILKPGDSLLDIGCGWGGMLIYAAQKYGINGIGITLSKNQYEYADRKIKELRLDSQIKVMYKDYRHLSENFDKVVSIGMFEHVGKNFIPIFIKKISVLLKKEGIGLLHTIGKDTPSSGDPWTFKYIFPGGYLPCLAEIAQEMGKTGFSILDVENLRWHYAKTLEYWVENYELNVEKVREMFDEAFVRRWRLFLNGSIAGFRYGNTRLFQVLFSNGINNNVPPTRAHVYREL
ncbi:MAG: cyclopropane-fatty-acyl-phospholipid synthase family protein [Thermodesulfobacteriota bacterium]|nr:cyclopropane-fatty-acyl-phospholipid synthase family protein [Thermodesulfobacteriota bacterium]